PATPVFPRPRPPARAAAAELQQRLERPAQRPLAAELVPPQPLLLGADLQAQLLGQLRRLGLPPRRVRRRPLGQPPPRPPANPHQRRPRQGLVPRRGPHQLPGQRAAILRLDRGVPLHLLLLIELVVVGLRLVDVPEIPAPPVEVPFRGRQVQRLPPREPEGLD